MSKASKKSKSTKKPYKGPRPSLVRGGGGAAAGGKNPIHVRTRAELERYLDAPEPVVIDFWAPWCAPCKQFGPTFDAVGTRFEGRVRFLKVNTEEATSIAEAFSIRSIPTVLALVGDDVVDSQLGMMSEVSLDRMASRLVDKAAGVSTTDKLKRFLGLGKASAPPTEA